MANGTPKKPPATAASKALRRYEDDFLLCRYGNLGHVWEVVGYFRSGIAGEVRRSLSCHRCGTERTDRWLSGSGERVASTYRYPADYRMELDGERMTSAEVRLEALRRADVYASESQMIDQLTRGA